MDPLHRDPSSYNSDLPPVPFSFPMPTPTIVVQMPRPNGPEMSYDYGKPDASGYPYPSEHTFSERLQPPRYPYVPEVAFGDPSQVPVSHPSEPQIRPWVPSLGQSDEAEVNSTSQPIFPNISESSYPTEQLLSTWVPELPGQAGEADFDPMAEPVCINTPDPVSSSQSVSPKRSPLKRFASFLGLARSKSRSSHLG